MWVKFFIMDPRPVIDGVEVDVASILAISHDCSPELCRERRCCCACYEIHLSGREVNRAVGFVGAASKWAKGLKRGGVLDNVFDEDDEGGYTIDTTSDGSCAFLYRDRSRTPLCSLHTAAVEAGANPHRVKPVSCTLWPLALGEGGGKVLSVQDDALDFPCNGRVAGASALDPGISAIIREVFGPLFLGRVEEAVKTGRW